MDIPLTNIKNKTKHNNSDGIYDYLTREIKKQKEEIERLNNIIKDLSDTLIDIYMCEYGEGFEEAVSIVNAIIKDI